MYIFVLWDSACIYLSSSVLTWYYTVVCHRFRSSLSSHHTANESCYQFWSHCIYISQQLRKTRSELTLRCTNILLFISAFEKKLINYDNLSKLSVWDRIKKSSYWKLFSQRKMVSLLTGFITLQYLLAWSNCKLSCPSTHNNLNSFRLANDFINSRLTS